MDPRTIPTVSTISINPTQSTTSANDFQSGHLPTTNRFISEIIPNKPAQYIQKDIKIIQQTNLLDKKQTKNFQINLINNAKESSVDLNLSLSNSKNKFTKFLIDTGAQISLLKINVINNNSRICFDEKVNLFGINLESSKTIGSYISELNIGNFIIKHKFHIVQESFPIEQDGILGLDFIKNSGAIIDVNNNTFTINDIVLHFEKRAVFKYIIPARTEQLLKIRVNTNKESICHSKTLRDNLYLANCLVKPVNNECIISIINSSTEPIEIDNIIPDLEPLENYNILSFKFNEDPIQNRLQKLESQLKLNHLNSEEHKSILDICREHNDLFFLEGDYLSCTNSVKHEISTLTDHAPINIRPYRLPESQKQEISKQVNAMLEGNIIQSSKSAWNSPLLVVPKKSGVNGEKKWRVVVDFRKLNDITISDAFPLPNITEILDQLGNSRYFSTLDLASGYHQIAMHESDRAKTAFSTQNSHFEFLRMPFGLKTAPATFQRLMNSVLTGLQGLKCYVYLDDVVVYGTSLSDHNSKLLDVFHCFRENNLKLQPEKCNFLCTEVVFLGHLITNEGIKPDPKNVRSVQEFPTPTNQTEIKSFLGMTGYYRKFIHHYAEIAKPLTLLLRDNVKFIWNAFCEEAFVKLKYLIINPPVLQYPDFNKEFILTTDASKIALGSVLSQGEKDLPVAYGSRGLNKPEENYSATELEMLAIVWSVQNFRPYLYGRHFKIYTDHKPLTYIFSVKDPSSRLMRWRLKLEEYDFEVLYKPGRKNVIADALSRANIEPNRNIFVTTRAQAKQPLDSSFQDFSSFLNGNNILSSQLKEVDKPSKHCSIQVSLVSRPEDIEELDLSDGEKLYLKSNNVILQDINNKKNIYLLLNSNSNPILTNEIFFDSIKILLNFCLIENISDIFLYIFPEIIIPLKYENVRNIFRFLSSKLTINIEVINKKRKILTDPEDIKQILKDYHNSSIGGHQGFQRTFRRIQQEYSWKNMFNDISKYIKTCDSCQKNKKLIHSKMPMKITSTSSAPLERIALDIVGPLPLTPNGNKYLLTFQDDLTKFVGAIPIPTQEADIIVRAFTEKIVLQYGIPKTILTDQGANFLSDLLKGVSKLLGIKKLQTTAYHPESNGALERSHSTFKEYLRNYINPQRDDWDSWIPFGIFTYNTTPHTATKYSPYELLYGFKPEIPTSLQKSPEVYYNYDNYSHDLKNKLQNGYKIARENLLIAKEISKNYYDRKTKVVDFDVGNLVLLEKKNKSSPKGVKGKKLGSLYDGPFEIVSIVSPENTEIKIGNKLVIVHNNRIKLHFT